MINQLYVPEPVEAHITSCIRIKNEKGSLHEEEENETTIPFDR
jgi:hypothetical protein